MPGVSALSVLALIPGFVRELRRIRDPYHRFQFALNRLFHHVTGGERRPAFFDVATTCPGLLSLEENQSLIRAELDALLAGPTHVPRYHEIDSYQDYISGSGDPACQWKVFALKAIAGEPWANQRQCPQTTALLNGVPHVLAAFFSILTPGKSIPAHCGPFVGRLRYHLALQVPRHRPPRLRIAEQVVTWEQGRSLLFDDSLEHEVYNESEEVRVVLVVDVMRPMAWPWHLLNWFAFRVVFKNSPHYREVLARI